MGGSLADVDALAARADVYQIRANHIYELEDEQLAAAPDAYGWNLDELDPNSNLWGMEAAQVWNQSACIGEGIVVANIDTGAYYEHDALDRQYRGNLTGNVGGPYDHNYNWYHAHLGLRRRHLPLRQQRPRLRHHRHHGRRERRSERTGRHRPGGQWIACKGCDDQPLLRRGPDRLRRLDGRPLRHRRQPG